jgi:hypothetical protein
MHLRRVSPTHQQAQTLKGVRTSAVYPVHVFSRLASPRPCLQGRGVGGEGECHGQVISRCMLLKPLSPALLPPRTWK